MLNPSYKITANMIDMLFWLQRKGVLINRLSWSDYRLQIKYVSNCYEFFAYFLGSLEAS